MRKGGWDRLRNRARMLGERDGNNKPLAEGDDDNDDNDDVNNEYNKDGYIVNNDNEYAIGVEGVDDPLDEGDDKYDTLSAAPTQACPESQRPSVPSR